MIRISGKPLDHIGGANREVKEIVRHAPFSRHTYPTLPVSWPCNAEMLSHTDSAQILFCGAIALLLALTIPTLSVQAQAVTCHLLTPETPLPEGFGAPWNTFSAAQEPVMSVTCTESNATLTVGTGNDLQYIYRFGYVWREGDWQQVALQGESLVANAWYVGEAETPLPQTTQELSNTNYVVAYTCTWTGTATGWKCGCRDQACTHNLWQLQAFRSNNFGTADPGPRLCTSEKDTKQTVSVSNASGLRSALSSASCGTSITVAPGTYSGDFVLRKSCSQSQPVVITSKPSGRPVFQDGTFTLQGEYLALAGMQFGNRATVTIDGDYNRVTRNLFTDDPAPASTGNGMQLRISAGSSHNRVDHNELAHFGTGFGIFVHVTCASEQTRGNRIDANYFHHKRGTGNGNESITILNDYWGDAQTIIEYNLLDQVKPEDNFEGEAFSIKSGGNVIRGNTLIGSPGMYFVNRSGQKNMWEANYTEGSTSGFQAFGDELIYEGNYAKGGRILLGSGDVTGDSPASKSPHCGWPVSSNGASGHPAVRTSVIENNTANEIVVGWHNGNRWTVYPTSDTILVGNGASTTKQFESNNAYRGGNATIVAHKLSPAEVGLDAPDRACD